MGGLLAAPGPEPVPTKVSISLELLRESRGESIEETAWFQRYNEFHQHGWVRQNSFRRGNS